MKLQSAVTFAFAAAHFTTADPIRKRAACACPSGAFKPLSAREWVKASTPGWNAGNTLDAVPNEGSWNNPPLQGSTLDTIKASGFKSVRIPVTYTHHFVGTSPDWTVDATWLQRVSDVIDMATSRGLYVLTNMHHDSWGWLDVNQPGYNATLLEEKFYAAWLQIGKKLACKPSTVAFEPINEPTGSTETHSANLMRLNDLFLKALADSGGYNPKRVVTLSALGMSIDKLPWFKTPANLTNPWAFQFHYYSPYDFIFGAWGKTTWGSASDRQAVTSDFAMVKGNFTDVPLVLGEFDASQLNCEAAARWKWFDHVVRTAASYDIVPFLWDNGVDNLDRATGRWRDLIGKDLIVSTVKGVVNSLADSTNDAAATTQESSAYVFNKVGGDVTADRRLPFILNGNRVEGLVVDGGRALKSGGDYVVEGEVVTLKKEFLKEYLFAGAAPGSKANVTVRFSKGTPSQVELVQWDVPKLGGSSFAARAVAADSDLEIPIEWKGLHMVAAVRILGSDGTFLVDDWTKWLPTLQQGRGTFNSHWNFDQDRVKIGRNAIQAVIASGKNTTFTFEFFPRAEGNGNQLDYVLTV
ncbi:glycoside hydrolase superfamily [Bombardia bombarda]|uniref:Glycoside hydrolase superfamily n=1 Tax=Bombardia bombarda TaxID=252184 RepID=A0AA39XMH6_9PEZI|nr:glycoside hydrolase superfamily [Bombardia bombarda]